MCPHTVAGMHQQVWPQCVADAAKARNQPYSNQLSSNTGAIHDLILTKTAAPPSLRQPSPTNPSADRQYRDLWWSWLGPACETIRQSFTQRATPIRPTLVLHSMAIALVSNSSASSGFSLVSRSTERGLYFRQTRKDLDKTIP